MATDLDPFDVSALERSLNDSAVRVSTIWVSYLLFGLYLAVAAANVTPRQIFLVEPIKLPILNIDLPFVGFFFLVPVLYVTLHLYVLIQVLLLARTALPYNEAVERTLSHASDRARVRQRLANTLFAQIFAGSPREREGLLGRLLQLMARLTLAITPVLVLVFFEFRLLPYHSHLLTWSHRILVAFDLLIICLLWPAIVSAEKEVTWSAVTKGRAVWIALIPLGLFYFIINFPGEPHSDWIRRVTSNRVLKPDTDFGPSIPLECDTPKSLTALLPANFDRLSLPYEDFVDDDTLAKIIKAGKEKGQQPYQTERTRKFHQRDFRCANLEGADLRHTDFTGANLPGARLMFAELQGATFKDAYMRHANLMLAKLQDASFSRAQLQGAWLAYADLQGTQFDEALLQGADLQGAKAPGAFFAGARLQGAVLSSADLRGAIFASEMYESAQLQGADLTASKMQGAFLFGVKLQGATLSAAQLQAANLSWAQLQGSVLDDSELKLALFSNSAIWRTSNIECSDAQVVNVEFGAFVDNAVPATETKESNRRITSTPEETAKFIEGSLQSIPLRRLETMRNMLRDRLTEGALEIDDSQKKIWLSCAANALPQQEYEEKAATYLVELACKPGDDQIYVAAGITFSFTPETASAKEIIANGLLSLNGKVCPVTGRLSAGLKQALRQFLATE
jgi:uncharacterized protein YjbI with pentapeptide repeats